MLMTLHYVDLGRVYDWLKQISPTRQDQSEALLRSGKWRVIRREFRRSFLRRHFAGKPVVASLVSDFFQVNHGPIVGNFESSPVVFVNLRAYTSSPLVFRNPLFVTILWLLVSTLLRIMVVMHTASKNQAFIGIQRGTVEISLAML